jgi:citrate lyase beta subunit
VAEEHAPGRRPGHGAKGMSTSAQLTPAALEAELDDLLAASDHDLERLYPGDRTGRQPVHTCYVPADAFGPDLPVHWGAAALAELERSAPDDAAFGTAMGLDPQLATEVRTRVLAKLAAEPIEDLRLDFEDGYRDHGGAAEVADARIAAARLAAAEAAGTRPQFTGLRCKSLERATRGRAVATLDAFLGELLAHGPLPSGFLVTLPKVTSAAQVQAMAVLCERLEQRHGLQDGQLIFEVQVETPQIVLGPDGMATVAQCVHAAAGRLAGLHYGTYDYSASLGIAAQFQSMEHPAADYARAVFQVASAGTGVRLSDGSSNVLPVGSRDEVRAAWQLSCRLISRSLARGFYQGWDLHPGQLASRYAATYGFYRMGLPAALARLQSVARRAPGAVLEEPATVRALGQYLIRGLDCGAVSEAEVVSACGFGRAQLDQLTQTGTAQ